MSQNEKRCRKRNKFIRYLIIFAKPLDKRIFFMYNGNKDRYLINFKEERKW